MQMFSNFVKPSAMGSSSESIRITDLENRLIIVVPDGDEVTIETSRGPADARPVKVLDVDAGTGWQEGIVFQRALRAQLGRASAAGSPLVGRLGRGPASPGKSAPWLIEDPSDAELERARAAYLKQEVPF